MTEQIHERHLDWIERRGISLELAVAMGLHTKSEGGKNWLAIPYQENGQAVNHKYRLTSEKAHRMDEGAPLTLWNHDALHEDRSGPVLITEGEWDALAAITSGFTRAVSVPNGAPQSWTENVEDATRYQFMRRNQAQLDRIESFIVATDNDEPGRILAAELVRLLGPERCKTVRYPDDCKDLNDVLILHGGGAVRDCIDAAKDYPVKGLYRADDFPEPPPIQSLDIGIDGMDRLFKLVPGTFAVLTGWAGQGKTSLLLAMLAKLLKRGVPMAVASFETMVKPILIRKMKAAIHECAEFDDLALKRNDADELLNTKFGIIAHSPSDDDTEIDLEYLLELAKVAVLRDGIRLLVIDPWNEIEHKRDANETETEYVGRAIRELKKFAKNYQCAVWLVAHPRKPQSDGAGRAPGLYDLAGSANFANKADYGLVVHRGDLTGSIIDVKVVKVRMGLPGMVGKVTLDFDPQTSSYTPFRMAHAA
ncbi:DnaB-like helicase C-terminal domain-containing protein [Parasphingopyxis sp.]|uniref:DnaB-like helicase C-terminal domain-containing protein n=1 Tax=Parasphingopyxis sp. TaxID=1920299 RepID=UPI00260ECAEF|nr:DnaB-like helicase C-terminal domain-containing protein [Parasphingopyxis sp.]